MSNEELQRGIHAYLRRNHPEICRHWFEEISVIGIDGGVLRLLIDEPVRLKYLQRSCVAPFTEAVQSITGRLLAVRFMGSETAATEPMTGAPTQEGTPLLDEQVILSPDYCFDSFVVGPGNRLAHAAAMAVGGGGLPSVRTAAARTPIVPPWRLVVASVVTLLVVPRPL